MTALLPPFYLRRYALPEHFLGPFRPARPVSVPLRAPTPQPRPHLLATWHVAPDGRPACRWSVEGASAEQSG